MTTPQDDNKKVEPPKSGASAAKADTTKPATTPTPTPPKDETPKTTTPPVARTPVDQPAETVKTPSPDDVKIGSRSTLPDDKFVDEHVKKTVDSVEAYNESVKKVEAAKPFQKPEVKTVRAPTADERLQETVERTAESVDAYNKSSKATMNLKTSNEEVSKKPEQSRVAPLTGELREDPEDDSYVTPGKVLKAPDPKPGEPAPEVERVPLVISPLTGEIKPADEISYPTPGHTRGREGVADVMDRHGHKFELEGSKLTKFGVPPGHQVPLLQANEHMWENDDAIREDRAERAKVLAEAMLGTDGLRRTRRVQKNLR